MTNVPKNADKSYEDGYRDGWASVPGAAEMLDIPQYRRARGQSEYQWGFAMGADDAIKPRR
ncbi:hypothetical protein ACWTU6_27210 [Mesorhizobium sp. BHbsci]